MDLSSVYFVIGTAYAGKSTLVKNLAKKHHGIALEENYHDAKLPELDSREFPNLTYTRDLEDWHEFIRRTPDEYVTWIRNVQKECETVELQMIEELLQKPEVHGKKIFVDTNICIETLHRISDTGHVLVMLSEPEISVRRFFERPDKEKQFLYQLMMEEPDPQASLDNYRKILTQINSQEAYDELMHSGFRVLLRDEERTQGETVLLAEEIFGIAKEMSPCVSGMIEFRKISDFPKGTLYDILIDAYSFDERNRQIWDKNWKETDDFFYSHPEIADEYGLVTCLDGEAIGFVTWDPRHRPDYVEIGHNGIRGKYKGRRYGRLQLLEALRRIMEYEGLKRIIVCTNSNLIAPKNYESVGFTLYDSKMNETESAYTGNYLYYEIIL